MEVLMTFSIRLYNQVINSKIISQTNELVIKDNLPLAAERLVDYCRQHSHKNTEELIEVLFLGFADPEINWETHRLWRDTIVPAIRDAVQKDHAGNIRRLKDEMDARRL
jgi:hypothetical protein